MPNPIKYSTGSETLSLKKGNFYIGTGDVGKGPSDTTGYYQGPSPASGGYVIYLNKEGAPGGLSYHSAANDSELISFTNNLSGTSFTSATQCLNYYATQTDKVCVNRDYEGIVTNGLVFNLDAGFTPSYSRSGTTWYDVSSISNNGTLTNGPTFNSDNGGSIVFDGADDYTTTTSQILPPTSFTINFFIRPTNFSQSGQRFRRIVNIDGNGLAENPFCLFVNTQGKIGYVFGNGSSSTDAQIPLSQSPTLSINNWYNVVLNFDGTSKNLYVNGLLYQTINNNGSFTNTSNKNLLIGYYGDTSNGGYWSGNIAIGQIYNRALSATEVLQNYNAQKGRFGL
jgi:hypothetical protein